MKKNERIEEMAKIIYENNYDSRVCARALAEKGYGNIEEFVNQLKASIPTYSQGYVYFCDKIDKLKKEFLKNE